MESNKNIHSRNNVNFDPWTKAENMERISFPASEIAFGFLKPGFEADLPEITKVLKNNGLELVYSLKMKLTPHAIDYIYQDHQQAHFYPVMKEFLQNNEVLLLLVGAKGKNAQEILNGLKKTKDGNDGIIREMFRIDEFFSKEEYEAWLKEEHPEQNKMTIYFTQSNVLHTAENTVEALQSLKILLGDKFNELRLRGSLPSELWDFFQESSLEKE